MNSPVQAPPIIGRAKLEYGTIVETCKLNGVEPHTYLTDVITRIIDGHPNKKSDDLLPGAYPTAQNILSLQH